MCFLSFPKQLDESQQLPQFNQMPGMPMGGQMPQMGMDMGMGMAADVPDIIQDNVEVTMNFMPAPVPGMMPVRYRNRREAKGGGGRLPNRTG